MSSNTFVQKFRVNVEKRRELNNHNSFLIFLTGLSGAGKTSIANVLEMKLFEQGIRTFVLDGDNTRKGINSDLEFDQESREENIRRIAHISKLFVDAGVLVIASFIAPFEKDREFVKEVVGPENFVEVFVHASLDECEKRDVKGLYKMARKGEIKNFTGVSSPYENPKSPDLVIHTEENSIEESAQFIYTHVKNKIELKN